MDDENPAADAPAEEAYVPNPELVKVTKDGETIFVHPNGLEEHMTLGWRLA